MSAHAHPRFRHSLMASTIAAAFCGLPPAALGQPIASPITINDGTHDISGAGYQDKYIEQGGGIVNVHDTVLGGDTYRSVNLTGGELHVGSGARLTQGIELHGTSSVTLGVNASTRATVGSSVSARGSNHLELDNVVINGGTGFGALRVQGASTATSTANTEIHATGDDNNGVIVGDTSSMLMQGSQVTSESGAGVVTIRSSSLNMDGVSSIGGRAGLFVQESSHVVVTGGTLSSTGNLRESMRLGDVYGAGVALIGHPLDTDAGRPAGSLQLSNVTVIGKGERSAGLVSQAENSDINIAIENSVIRGDRDGMVFNIDDRDVDHTTSEVTRITLVNTPVEGKTGAAMRVAENAKVDMVLTGSKSTLTGAAGLALTTANGSKTNLTIGNGARILGDAINLGGLTNITLDSGGSWRGRMQDVSSLTVASGGSMEFTGNSSLVSTLSMQRGSVVKLGGTAGNFHTVSVESLAGEGEFEFGADASRPGTPAGDLLVVRGQASGRYSVAVADTGNDPASNGEAAPLTIVKTGGGDARFSLNHDTVALGTYNYTLARNGTNWELRPTTQTTPYTNAVVNIMSVSPTIWYGQLLTVRERFGELSFQQDRGGVWIRPYGSQFNVKSAAGPRFKQTQSGVAVGADKAFDFLGGKTYIGGLFNYSTSSLDDHYGAKGSVDAYSVGAYATWLGNQGYYLHGLVTANRYISKARATTVNGTNAEGSFNTNGVGVSLEGGRRFNTSSKWFIQPYGQLSALHMQGSRFSLNNGMRADGDSVDSLQAAIGTQIGRAFHSANGDVVEPYVRIAVAHEFVKSNDISINGHSFNANLSGSRLELGLGTAVQVGKHLSAHLDYSYAQGSKLTQPFFLNAGLRYEW